MCVDGIVTLIDYVSTEYALVTPSKNLSALVDH